MSKEYEVIMRYHMTSAKLLWPALIVALTSCSGPTSNVGPTALQAQRLPPTGLAHSGARSAASGTTDWDTFGFDLRRTGYNPNETIGRREQRRHAAEGLEFQRRLDHGSRARLRGRRKRERSSDEHLIRWLRSRGRRCTRSTLTTGAVVWQAPVPYASPTLAEVESRSFQSARRPRSIAERTCSTLRTAITKCMPST